MDLLIEIILLIIGFVFLIKGSDLLLKSATSIAKKLGLSEILIGLTIVAIGTSLPEIFITVSSSIDGHSDLILGNAIGSCICNFLFVLGITSIIRPIKFDKRIVKRHFPIFIGVITLILFFSQTEKIGEFQTITRYQGIILLLCMFLYVIYTIYEENKLKNEIIDQEIINDVEAKEHYSIIQIIVYMILGILGLKYGSDLVVDNAVMIAGSLGLSERFIGMTVVAIGTALPETITGIIAAKKGETDLLLGNVSGSNILNLCLLIGLGAIINPLMYTTNFDINLLILVIITVGLQLMAIINKNSELSRKKGFILLLTYAIYIFTMI